MTDELHLAQVMLKQSGISLLDAARLIQQILDFRQRGCSLQAMPFCAKVIQLGLAHFHLKEMSVAAGFELYVETKADLRPDSLRDIKYLGKRLLSTCPELAERNFSALSVHDCTQWLAKCFLTPSQFNKGRAFLHALFAFALRREWCERNVIHLIERKKIIEKEIKPLSVVQAQSLLKQSRHVDSGSCRAAVGILLWAGLRPTELRRLRWGDIDLKEGVITVRAQCSQTGGVRQVDICPPLLLCLKSCAKEKSQLVCPADWLRHWRMIREQAGFKGQWVQDVLRHTFASYHAKYFRNLPQLQLIMGHRDQSLLRARYVNMGGISQDDAQQYFKIQTCA